MREMFKEKRDGFEIDLQKLLFSYLQKWWLILLCTVVVAAAACGITKQFITPMYQSSVMIYVNNIRGDQQVDSITSSNLSTSQRLVGTYVNIIKSDTVLEKVADASGMDITAAGIRAVMSAEQVEETELFKVIITHPDPAVAAQLANAVAKVAPAEIEEFVEGSSTKIIDYAKVPKAPSSPSMMRNAILGALIGCVLAVGWLTVMFLLDVRIKDEEDLLMLAEFPVLGQIPEFLQEEGKQRGGYSKKAYEVGAAAKRGARK